MSKILTVFGANGQQGGGLIAYLLKHPILSLIYKLHGVNRDPSKPAAAALKKRGWRSSRLVKQSGEDLLYDVMLMGQRPILTIMIR